MDNQLKEATSLIENLKNRITELEAENKLLKGYLDEAGISYTDDELMNYSTKITQFIVYGPGIMVVMVYGVYGDDISRMIYMHFPEVNYPLIEAL